MRKIIVVIMLAGLVVLFGCSSSEKTSSGGADSNVAIIPVPSYIEMESGTFEMSPGFRILVDDNSTEVKNVAEYFAERLRVASGFEVPVGNLEDAKEGKTALALSLGPSENNLGKEGYQLEVKTERIDLRANQPAGLFFGIQTIFQLLPDE